MSHKVHLVELHVKDAMKLMQHVPDTESKFEPIRGNDENYLCSCTGRTGRNKMAAINRGALTATFDWNDCFCFFMYLNAKKAVPPRFEVSWLFCPLKSC